MSASGVRVACQTVGAFMLIGGGCSKPATVPTVPSNPPPPSAFFKWCDEHMFGVDSPQSKRTAASIKNLPGAPVGDVEFEAWTKCATAAEAETYLAGVERNLRRAVHDTGVQVEDSPTGSNDGFTLQYRADHIRGTLKGSMELRDNKEGGKTVKRYFLRLNLTEVPQEP